MSYCRFSSDDFQCDVYVYADVSGGYTTHVAGARVVFNDPLPSPADSGDVEAWINRHMEVSKLLRRSDKKPIGLEFDDQSFNDATAAECADRLESLKSVGYNVPQSVIDALREKEE